MPILGALLVLLAAAGFARYLCAPGWQRSALSVLLVVLGLVTAFFFFFAAGSWVRGHRSEPRPRASASPQALVASSAVAFQSALEASPIVGPNPSMQSPAEKG
jgi:hypothetical protein